jgi:hypothetical protein
LVADKIEKISNLLSAVFGMKNGKRKKICCFDICLSNERKTDR